MATRHARAWPRAKHTRFSVRYGLPGGWHCVGSSRLFTTWQLDSQALAQGVLDVGHRLVQCGVAEGERRAGVDTERVDGADGLVRVRVRVGVRAKAKPKAKAKAKPKPN